MIESRRFLRGFAAFAFFTVLAGDFWRYSITWFGWSAVILAMAVIAGILLVRAYKRGVWRFDVLPYPLLAFVALTVLSTAWSAYPAFTAVASLTTVITAGSAVMFAFTLTRAEILQALGVALRFVLGLSLLFEFIVAVFIRQPILPWWTDYRGLKVHPADYWSRDLLFSGDRIQGIVGNSNLLGFAALLGLIVFAIQLATGSVRKRWGYLWLAVAVGCLLLTRSGTVTVALVAVIAATVVLLLLRHASTRRGRVIVSVGTIVVLALGAVGAILAREPLLRLLGKSPDLTGRTDIWSAVIGLAQQRPVGGWGWISYWAPFIEPFDSPAFVKGGVQLLQAHEAWLDIWFQLGIVGLVVFGALVLSTVVRAWATAIDRPQLTLAGPGRYSALSLLPILILVALLAQSLAESRLLIEYGMLLLSLFAVLTKRRILEPAAE